MFTGVKICPIIDKPVKFVTGDNVRVVNDDDDMDGTTGTFVYETNNIYGELVYVILLEGKKHYSTYPKFLEKMTL